MNSAERIKEYTELPSEAPREIPEAQPPADWPQTGAITFESVSYRYREKLPLVLKQVFNKAFENYHPRLLLTFFIRSR